MSLQDELEVKALKKLQSHNEKSREGMKKYHSIRALNISALEAKIAEEANPMLRHGRCGITSLGEPYITIGNGKDAVIFFEDGSYDEVGTRQGGISHDGTEGARTVFEAFDDLKATQENVTEFEFKEYDPSDPFRAELKDDGEIRMSIKGNTLCVYEEEIPAFVLGVRQMHATYLRKQQKVSE